MVVPESKVRIPSHSKVGGKCAFSPPPNKNRSNFFQKQPIDLKISGSSEQDVKRSNPGFQIDPRIFGGSGTPILTICRYFLIKIWSNFWNWDLTVIPKRLLPNDSYPIGNIQVSEGITTSNNIVLKHFLTFWDTINVFSIKSQMVPQAYNYDWGHVL